MIDSPSVMIDEGSVKTKSVFNEYSASSKQSSSARREMSKHFSRDVSKILEIFCLYLKDVGNLLFSFKDPGNLLFLFKRCWQIFCFDEAINFGTLACCCLIMEPSLNLKYSFVKCQN